MVVFQSRGSLASAHLSNFWLQGAGLSSWWVDYHPLFGPTCTNIWGSGPCRNDLISSPPCAPVESFLGTLTGVSEPAVTSVLQT